ncbi:ABC transporter ATP-binding protein [Propionibacterium freudenreichii]|nr:ABC transporter ATP-binding protein [Propionibacterium freudenreichii]
MSPDDPRDVLSAVGLVKNYGPVSALAGVDLAIRHGETVAVMGPSGCGKSTLLHVLGGILLPDEGDVLLKGGSIRALSDAERSALRLSSFGFVFQDGQLLPELTNEENVALPLIMAGLSRREAVARAHEWLGRFGLAGIEQRRPGQLSGGQAQRVAIARALVHGPGVVFADEPTGALDQGTGREVMEVLTSSVSANGASLVMVTHDPGVAAWCSRTVSMCDGRVIADSAAPQGVSSSASASTLGVSFLPTQWGFSRMHGAL